MLFLLGGLVETSPPYPPLISPSVFLEPLDGCIEINFDGASKGNPCPTGYGNVIWHYRGNPWGIYMIYYAHTTNNVVELIALEKGLILAHQQHCHQIHIVGDSILIIRMN